MGTKNKGKYGEWAIVTGASDGIGKAFAIEIAQAGYSLLLVARSTGLLEKLGEELFKKYGTKYIVVSADLSVASEVEKVIHKTAPLDIGLLVTAAGFGTSGSFINGPIEAELSMLDVNCRAVVSFTHHFGNLFCQKKRGGIILLSSIVAFQGVPRAANYAATKAYIQTLAEALFVEIKPYGVDVLSVAPGPVRSGFGARANMKISDGAEKPETIARVSLQALGKRTTVRPGLIAKFLGYSLSIAPRFMRVRIMALIMGGMTRHQK